MDIDGAEVATLKGMTKTLSNKFLRIVIVEVFKDTAEAVELILEAAGFKKTQDRVKARGNEIFERC